MHYLHHVLYCGIPFITWNFTRSSAEAAWLWISLLVSSDVFLWDMHYIMMLLILNFSNGAQMEENAVRLLRIAWWTFPLGILITFMASTFVFWWQALKFSDPYAQAILIHGNLVISITNVSAASYLIMLYKHLQILYWFFCRYINEISNNVNRAIFPEGWFVYFFLCWQAYIEVWNQLHEVCWYFLSLMMLFQIATWDQWLDDWI